MMKNIFLFLIFTMLGITSAWGRITLNVGMIYKKGIDKDLVLVSELHSVKEFYGTEVNSIEMKNGIKAELKAYFIHREEDYGPSSVVRVMGKIFNSDGKLIREFKRGEMDVFLGTSQKLVHEDVQNQIIELIFEPRIQ